VAPKGAIELEVVAFGGIAPSGGGAKGGINALSESKNKSEIYVSVEIVIPIPVLILVPGVID
jgi:hypothetical protein